MQKTPPPESCSQESILRATERCKLITDESGPFGECLTTLGEEATEYQESCVYDLCSMVDDDTLLCPSLEAFATECEVKGHKVNWRTKDRCRKSSVLIRILFFFSLLFILLVILCVKYIII